MFWKNKKEQKFGETTKFKLYQLVYTLYNNTIKKAKIVSISIDGDGVSYYLHIDKSSTYKYEKSLFATKEDLIKNLNETN